MNAPPLSPPEIESVEDLRALQRLMAGILFAPLNPRGDVLASVRADGQSVRRLAESFIKPNSRLSAPARLEIYARQYWYRLLDNLYDDFPTLRALLGGRRFHKLCRAYLAVYPSESWTLRNLGSRLERFILERPEETAPWTAAAADICRLEWAQTVAFDEAHLPAPDPESLLGSDPAVLTLRLQPHITLLRADHAVDRFFFKVRRGGEDSRSGTSSGAVSLEAAPAGNGSGAGTVTDDGQPSAKRVRHGKPRPGICYLAVHRFENSVHLKRLPREAWLLLSALRDGSTVAAAVGTALEDADPQTDWVPKIREWFETWGRLGWFCENGPGAEVSGPLAKPSTNQT
jgi:hypothetical protein